MPARFSQPCDLQAFPVGGEDAIAASWIDDHAGPSGSRCRQMHRNLRAINLRIAKRPRRTVRPEFDRRIVQRVSQWS